MAENFKELLDEQKKTNQLLVQSMKDPDLGSSIKQNLGEILNASRLAGSSEKFQKQEGITEVDEAQKKTTETIAKSSVLQLEQSQGSIFQLVKIQEGLAILGTQLNRMLKKDNISRVVNRLKEFSPDPKDMMTKSEQEENDKKVAKNTKKQVDALEKVAKNSGFLKDIKDGFLKIGKDIFGGIGGTLKKIFALAGLFGLYKVLTDENLKKLAETLDKHVLPALKDLTKFLLNLATNILTYVTDSIKTIVDPDATFMDKVGASIGLLMVAVIGIYSKAILKYLGAMAGVGLLKIGGFTAAAVFAPVGVVIIGFIALFASIFKGLFDSFKVGKETFKKYGFERLDQTINEAGLTFIAEFLGFIPQLIVDAIGFFVGIFSPKLKEKINEIDVSQYIRKTMDNMIEAFQMLGEAFTMIIDKMTGGLLLGDERKMVENYAQKIRKLKDKRQTAENMDFTTAADLLAIDEEIEELKKTKRRVRAFDRSGATDLREKLKFLGSMKIGTFYHGGALKGGNLALIGETAHGRGGELVYSGNDAMVMNQSRTDQLLTMALEKGLSGGDGNNAPTIITTDNSVRSNTSNMISSPSMITSNDSLMNSITNSV